MQTTILALIVFGVLIFVHELGHFIFAKLVGIRVEEFSIGMGPKFFSRQKGETLYSLRVLPMGGFVKMSGESGFEEENLITKQDSRRFNNKTIGQRAAVIAAGPLMNLFSAVIFFAVIFLVIGVPSPSTFVNSVVENSPAEKAGIIAGDKIIAIEGSKINKWDQMVEIIHEKSGEKLNFTIERNNKQNNFVITPELDPETNVGLIGIVRGYDSVNPIKAFWLGAKRTADIFVFTIESLIQVVSRKVTGGIAGPVGIIQMIGQTAESGFIYVINFMAVISVNLAILNLLPIPALDGSKLLFLGIEGLRGKPIDAKKENFVHLIGFALLITLMLFVTYQDILKLIKVR